MNKWINTRDAIRENTTKRGRKSQKKWLFVFKTRPLVLHRATCYFVSVIGLGDTHHCLRKATECEGCFWHFVPTKYFWFHTSNPLLRFWTFQVPTCLSHSIVSLCMCMCDYAYLAVWLGQTYFGFDIYPTFVDVQEGKMTYISEFLFIIVSSMLS